MMALIHATHPPTTTSKLIAAYMSPELPKRPQYVREVGSIVYEDREGYHTVTMLEAEDRYLADLLKNQNERSVYLGTRVAGLTVEYHVGNSVADAIQVASKFAAK